MQDNQIDLTRTSRTGRRPRTRCREALLILRTVSRLQYAVALTLQEALALCDSELSWARACESERGAPVRGKDWTPLAPSVRVFVGASSCHAVVRAESQADARRYVQALLHERASRPRRSAQDLAIERLVQRQSRLATAGDCPC